MEFLDSDYDWLILQEMSYFFKWHSALLGLVTLGTYLAQHCNSRPVGAVGRGVRKIVKHQEVLETEDPVIPKETTFKV